MSIRTCTSKERDMSVSLEMRVLKVIYYQTAFAASSAKLQFQDFDLNGLSIANVV
jgi:hypothetical protein